MGALGVTQRLLAPGARLGLVLRGVWLEDCSISFQGSNRPRYNRDHLRYPSDVTDEEWAHVEPLIPPAKRGGRKREAAAEGN